MIKLSQKKQMSIGAVLSYVQTLISVLLSLVYTPIMLNLLGKTEYGLYNIAATVISYVNILNMGFSSSYVRFYSRANASDDKDAVAKTNGLFCIVFFAIGVIALISGVVLTLCAELIFADGLSPAEYLIAKKIMLILTVSTAYNLATTVFSSIILAHERFVYHRVVNLIKTILSPSLTWVLLLLGYRSVAMSLITASTTILADTFYLIYCFRVLKIKVDFKNPARGELKEISFFSAFIAVNYIVDQINWSIDKILLGRYWGAEHTAVYSVASTIHSVYMQLSTAISTMFIPRVNKMVAEKCSDKDLSDLFISIGRVQMIILLPVLLGFVFLGKPFIGLWTPEGYDQVYVISLLLIAPVTVTYVQNIGISIQTAQNKHKFRAMLYLGTAIANLIVSIILCPEYGAIGCAIGTALSLIIGNGIIMNVYYHRVIKLNVIEFWQRMMRFVPSAIVLSVVGIMLNRFLDIDTWLEFLIAGIAFVSVYIVSLWLTVVTKEEKQKIKDTANRLFNKGIERKYKS